MTGVSFNQDQIWVDIKGREHLIDNMDLSYKKNVVAFVQRRAPRMVGRALANKYVELLAGTNIAPCVLGERDGVPVECNAGPGNRWAHGIDHQMVDYDKYPEAHPGLKLPTVTDEEAVDIINKTTLMKRLIKDIEESGE